MKTLGTLALIFFVWASFAHGEQASSPQQQSSGLACDRGPNIIRVQLNPAPHRDIPTPTKRQNSRAITNCANSNNSCEAAKAELPLAAQQKKGGCCYVNWVDCLNGAGAKDAPPKNDNKYAEELEACYSQKTPELKGQILQQCTAQFDEAQQKALDAWKPYQERNGTIAFSFKGAKSCLDKAQHSCLSGTTGLFYNVALNCCIAGKCDQLAKEVQYDEQQNCSGSTFNKLECFRNALKKSKASKAQCEAAYQCVIPKKGIPLP